MRGISDYSQNAACRGSSMTKTPERSFYHEIKCLTTLLDKFDEKFVLAETNRAHGETTT
jgi:hypothetical protein